MTNLTSRSNKQHKTLRMSILRLKVFLQNLPYSCGKKKLKHPLDPVTHDALLSGRPKHTKTMCILWVTESWWILRILDIFDCDSHLFLSSCKEMPRVLVWPIWSFFSDTQENEQFSFKSLCFYPCFFSPSKLESRVRSVTSTLILA